MICPTCSHETPPGAKFCTRCGTPVTPPTEAAPVADLASAQPAADELSLLLGASREATPVPGPVRPSPQPPLSQVHLAEAPRPEPHRPEPRLPEPHRTEALAPVAHPEPSRAPARGPAPLPFGPLGRQRITFTGHFAEFGLFFLLLFVASVCTFGLAFPYLTYWTVKYFFTKMRIGDQRIVYVGTFGEYFLTALGLLVVSVLTFGLVLPYYAYWTVRYFFTRLELEGV